MTGFESKSASIKGFSLIEVIATIIVMSVLAAFFIHYMGTAVTDSYKTVDFVWGEADAEGKIEEIVAYFTSKINSDPDNALSMVVGEYSGQADFEYVEFDVSGNISTVSAGTSPTVKVTVEAPGNSLETILTRSRTGADDPKVNY